MTEILSDKRLKEMAQENPCIFNFVEDYAHWTWDECVQFAKAVIKEYHKEATQKGTESGK